MAFHLGQSVRVPNILTTPKIGGVPHHALERCIPPIAVASMADRLQRRPNAIHSQKRNRPPQCLKRSTHVDNQAAFVALTGGTLTPGRFNENFGWNFTMPTGNAGTSSKLCTRDGWNGPMKKAFMLGPWTNFGNSSPPPNVVDLLEKMMSKSIRWTVKMRPNLPRRQPHHKHRQHIRFFFTFYLFNIQQPITTISSNNKCSDECSWSSTHLYIQLLLLLPDLLQWPHMWPLLCLGSALLAKCLQCSICK